MILEPMEFSEIKTLTARLNSGLNKALDKKLGRPRETFFHIIGTSASVLTIHLVATLPLGLHLNEYREKWFVGFIVPPHREPSSEEEIRKLYHWANLCAKQKTLVSEDFECNYH